MIKKFLKNWLISYKFKQITKKITQTGYNLVDVDFESKTFLVDLGNNFNILITGDKDNLDVLRLESAIVFNGDSLNLKTFSDISNIFYSTDTPITGIFPQHNGRVKFYISQTVLFKNLKSLKSMLGILRDSVNLCNKYLSLRDKHTKEPMLDISMFADFDLTGINLKQMGEQKEFVWGTWSAFVRAIVASHEAGEINSNDAGIMLKELKACELFEAQNKLLLSEVGDVVWQEIMWSRDFDANLPSDKTYVN